MTTYNPPISERDTEELIAIANSSTDLWQQDAIDQARNELRKRKISLADEKKILDKWEQEERQAEIEYEQKRELNKTESYTIFEMIAIFFLSILIVFWRIRLWEIGASLSDLWRENYKKKFVQRIILLIAGFAFWIYIPLIGYENAEKLRLKEIENTDISKWERNQNIKTLSVEIPFAGCWVSEDYYKSIKKYKSPKKAQSGAQFIEIPKRTLLTTTIINNFHEGSATMVVLKNMGHYELWGYDEDSIKQHLYNIKVVSPTKIKIGTTYYIKINVTKKDYSYTILEELLFKGIYTTKEGKKVEFKNNGRVEGLDDFKYYTPYIDYYDAGMGIDQISLGKSENTKEDYGFKYKNNVLEIYKIKCLVYDTADKRCVDVAYGKLLYKLTKNKD